MHISIHPAKYIEESSVTTDSMIWIFLVTVLSENDHSKEEDNVFTSLATLKRGISFGVSMVVMVLSLELLNIV